MGESKDKVTPNRWNNPPVTAFSATLHWDLGEGAGTPFWKGFPYKILSWDFSAIPTSNGLRFVYSSCFGKLPGSPQAAQSTPTSLLPQIQCPGLGHSFMREEKLSWYQVHSYWLSLNTSSHTDHSGGNHHPGQEHKPRSPTKLYPTTCPYLEAWPLPLGL